MKIVTIALNIIDDLRDEEYSTLLTVDNFERYHQLRNTMEPEEALYAMLEEFVEEEQMRLENLKDIEYADY